MARENKIWYYWDPVFMKSSRVKKGPELFLDTPESLKRGSHAALKKVNGPEDMVKNNLQLFLHPGNKTDMDTTYLKRIVRRPGGDLAKAYDRRIKPLLDANGKESDPKKLIEIYENNDPEFYTSPTGEGSKYNSKRGFKIPKDSNIYKHLSKKDVLNNVWSKDTKEVKGADQPILFSAKTQMKVAEKIKDIGTKPALYMLENFVVSPQDWENDWKKNHDGDFEIVSGEFKGGEKYENYYKLGNTIKDIFSDQVTKEFNEISYGKTRGDSREKQKKEGIEIRPWGFKKIIFKDLYEEDGESKDVEMTVYLSEIPGKKKLRDISNDELEPILGTKILRDRMSFRDDEVGDAAKQQKVIFDSLFALADSNSLLKGKGYLGDAEIEIVAPGPQRPPNSMGVLKSNLSNPKSPYNLSKKNDSSDPIKFIKRLLKNNERYSDRESSDLYLNKSIGSTFHKDDSTAKVVIPRDTFNSIYVDIPDSNKYIEMSSKGNIMGKPFRDNLEDYAQSMKSRGSKVYMDNDIYNSMIDSENPKNLKKYFSIGPTGKVFARSSFANKNDPDAGFTYEHVVPNSVINRAVNYIVYKRNKESKDNNTDTSKTAKQVQEDVKKIIEKLYRIAYVTQINDNKLKDAGYQSDMPNAFYNKLGVTPTKYIHNGNEYNSFKGKNPNYFNADDFMKKIESLSEEDIFSRYGNTNIDVTKFNKIFRSDEFETNIPGAEIALDVTDYDESGRQSGRQPKNIRKKTKSISEMIFGYYG